uniref:Xyloglucan endotransglucosylase/hydrolase n=1 Tax=Micrasterias denticulata TaxID=407018 RepID=G4V4D1_9VIRI|nr:xyloglucan endotransglucosylase/hydrolase [Micrasterias denticulata]
MASVMAALVLIAACAAPAMGVPRFRPRTAGATPGPTMACDTWTGAALCSVLPGGVTELVLNKYGGGAMQIPNHYLTGQFSMDMKLPAGNSGGTATTFYLLDSITPTNKDPRHSEVDIEFFGNTTGNPMLFATNIFCGGFQNLAQFRLPFDPAAAYHNYGFRWNTRQIVWLVDGQPIRVLNRTPRGPWPLLAMKPQSSIWATPWTVIKPDFTFGPLKVFTKNFVAQGCPALKTQVMAAAMVPRCAGAWNAQLTPVQLAAYARLRKATLVVDYGWDKA